MRDSTPDATPMPHHENGPYLRLLCLQPRGLAAMVGSRLGEPDKGQSGHRQHRLQRLPLVPRYGARDFEDSAAAAFMNEHFVSIKVDREERYDVDSVYMTAVQLMTQRGGWPLNAICLPDGRPIYGGTYFPRERWLQALSSILKTRAEKPERVLEYAETRCWGAAIRVG